MLGISMAATPKKDAELFPNLTITSPVFFGSLPLFPECLKLKTDWNRRSALPWLQSMRDQALSLAVKKIWRHGQRWLSGKNLILRGTISTLVSSIIPIYIYVCIQYTYSYISSLILFNQTTNQTQLAPFPSPWRRKWWVAWTTRVFWFLHVSSLAYWCFNVDSLCFWLPSGNLT